MFIKVSFLRRLSYTFGSVLDSTSAENPRKAVFEKAPNHPVVVRGVGRKHVHYSC